MPRLSLGSTNFTAGEISPRLRRERTSEIDIAALRVLIATDPPDHTLLRRVVSRPFTPRAIADLEPRIREIAATCVDDLLAADERGRADFVAHAVAFDHTGKHVWFSAESGKETVLSLVSAREHTVVGALRSPPFPPPAMHELHVHPVDDAVLLKKNRMCPPARSAIAGPPPLYGTWFSRMPAWRRKSSSARCCAEPLPEDAQSSPAGVALPSATISATDFTGTAGCTTSRFGTTPARNTGMNSFALS